LTFGKQKPESKTFIANKSPESKTFIADKSPERATEIRIGREPYYKRNTQISAL